MKITCKQTDYRYQSQTGILYNLYTKVVILRAKLDQFLKPRGNLGKNWRNTRYISQIERISNSGNLNKILKLRGKLEKILKLKKLTLQIHSNKASSQEVNTVAYNKQCIQSKHDRTSYIQSL